MKKFEEYIRQLDPKMAKALAEDYDGFAKLEKKEVRAKARKKAKKDKEKAAAKGKKPKAKPKKK